MTVTQKYGFRFAPATWQSPVVQDFFYDHLHRYGYPMDITPAATAWAGTIRGDRVYGVFGWHLLPGGQLNVSDFYTAPGRWGALAAYAALERIKADAERTNMRLVTPTPARNVPMIRAYKRVFGLPAEALPDLHIYFWSPAVQATESPELAEVS
jgi:hypothetical protein